MKLPLLLFALVVSLHGWCASVTPSLRTDRTTTPSHSTIENGKLQEATTRPFLSDRTKAEMIGWGLIPYLAIIVWWTIAAKRSLDRILEDVLQDIARHSS